LINALKSAADTYGSSTNDVSPNISTAQIMEAARLIAAALVKTQDQKTIDTQLAESAKTRESVERIDQLVTSKASKPIAGASVLWVDDRPTNNTFEQRALEALGIHFTLSTSTKDALKQLSEKKYDVIISDMGRPLDPQAGYHLLDKIKERQINTPFIIYAGSRSPEQVAEARKRGALGTTNNPQELFEMVVDAIKNG
jgi:CheY-like chemotaxis protein